MKGEEYRPGQPIMLNVGRGRGRKKTRKLWVFKELKMDGKIEVEEPYSRRTKVITKARVCSTQVGVEEGRKRENYGSSRN